MLAALFLAAAAAFVPVLHEGDAVPALPLVDQSGRAFSLQSFRGDAVVVAFVYTRCADARMCPLVAAKFARMQHALGAAPIRLVTLTLDPAYDTPAVLRRYGTSYGQDGVRWISGTGTAETLEELATRFDIAASRTQPGRIVHTEIVAVLDRDARVSREIAGSDWAPEDVLALARGAAGTGGAAGAFEDARLWLTTAASLCGARAGGLNGFAVLGILIGALLLSGAAFARSFRRPRARRRDDGQTVPRPSA